MIDVNDPSISTPMGQNCPATFKIVVPTVDEGLALRIEEALSVLVFSLVEKAHDVQSQFKVIAELHKLARLKQQRHRRAMDIARLRLSERRMAALENEQKILLRQVGANLQPDIRQYGIEILRPPTEGKSSLETQRPANANGSTKANAPAKTNGLAQIMKEVQAATASPVSAVKNLDALVQTAATQTAAVQVTAAEPPRMNIPVPAPVAPAPAAPVEAKLNGTKFNGTKPSAPKPTGTMPRGNRKERRRAAALLKKSGKLETPGEPFRGPTPGDDPGLKKSSGA